MTDTAGFLVWTRGHKSPEPQRWADRPRSTASDYWSDKAGRVLHTQELSEEEYKLPVDTLARLYPLVEKQSGAMTAAE